MANKSNWKGWEREVAKKLGGKRVTRGSDFGESKEDVEHSLFSIECKKRSKLSVFFEKAFNQAKGYAKNRIPIVAAKEKGKREGYIYMKIDDFAKIYWALYRRINIGTIQKELFDEKGNPTFDINMDETNLKTNERILNILK